MSSFRQLIKDSSGLGEGVIVRTHLLNLGAGGGTVILRGEKTVDKGKILSATINRILSGNLTSPILTADKGRVLSGSINRNLEGSVCRI